MNEVAMNAEAIAGPVIEGLGYELVETDYKKVYGNPTLTFYVYKKGGITHEDCEKISSALDSVLEENDISHGAFYHLNVSSLGLDRPIITEDDFRRNLDEDIELVFREPIGKKKSAHGILVAYDAESITIKEKGKEVAFLRDNLSAVRPYISF